MFWCHHAFFNEFLKSTNYVPFFISTVYGGIFLKILQSGFFHDFGVLFKGVFKKLSLLAVEEYFKVAKKHKISLAQLSLAFVNQQPFVTSNIIGATTMKQLKEDIDSINVELSPEIIDEINLVHKNNPNPAP